MLEKKGKQSEARHEASLRKWGQTGPLLLLILGSHILATVSKCTLNLFFLLFCTLHLERQHSRVKMAE